MSGVCVLDTSVVVDLERGQLLQAIFSLDMRFLVPDLLYEEELADGPGPMLLTLGLQRVSLDGKGVILAQSCAKASKAVSRPDAFAYALAKQGGHILLVGDAALRQFAEADGVSCHGVLWVLDLIEASTARTRKQLRDGLHAISTHPRCRLPKDLVEDRLKKYAK